VWNTQTQLGNLPTRTSRTRIDFVPPPPHPLAALDRTDDPHLELGKPRDFDCFLSRALSVRSFAWQVGRGNKCEGRASTYSQDWLCIILLFSSREHLLRTTDRSPSSRTIDNFSILGTIDGRSHRGPPAVSSRFQGFKSGLESLLQVGIYCLYFRGIEHSNSR
jgi:hypothetical protein